MNKPITGYLIDPANRRITEVQIEDHHCINRHIGSQLFCIGTYLPDGDVIFVDDEGLLYEKRIQHFFRIDDRVIESSNPQTLAGIGIVLGSDYDGESTPPRITIEQLTQAVRWIGAGMVIATRSGFIIDHNIETMEEVL